MIDWFANNPKSTAALATALLTLVAAILKWLTRKSATASIGSVGQNAYQAARDVVINVQDGAKTNSEVQSSSESEPYAHQANLSARDRLEGLPVSEVQRRILFAIRDIRENRVHVRDYLGISLKVSNIAEIAEVPPTECEAELNELIDLDLVEATHNAIGPTGYDFADLGLAWITEADRQERDVETPEAGLPELSDAEKVLIFVLGVNAEFYADTERVIPESRLVKHSHRGAIETVDALNGLRGKRLVKRNYFENGKCWWLTAEGIRYLRESGLTEKIQEAVREIRANQ